LLIQRSAVPVRWRCIALVARWRAGELRPPGILLRV
jgi:hypothetical protein